jgi:integral membrane protein
VRNLFTAYRVLAIVVGILLAFGTFVAMPLRYLTTDGSDLQKLGETLSVVWMIHGFLYMGYLVVAFLFARMARWTLQFTLLMLVAGVIPILIFWVEHRVVQRTRAEHPELVSG